MQEIELDEAFHKLSKKVIPLNYKIQIWPNLKTLTFNGKVSIDLQVNLE